MKLMLNMIVRNEGARIERALNSVAPYITSWVIIDTGSTDDTKDRIVKFFREWGIPGEIRDEPFVDFEQARNAALGWARKLAPFYQADYLLLMDADMELRVDDVHAFQSFTDDNPIAVDMSQQSGSVQYTNTRLLIALGDFAYKGVTHEYLDVRADKQMPRSIAHFFDHADGANRPDKFKRDIRLLTKALKKEPSNPRYMYYLASSYRDAGKHAEAAKWFQRRVRAGGWDEEVWSAQIGYATALKDVGDTAGFIREMLTAYNMRPTRAEAMYDLSVYLREHGQPAPALAAIEAVEHLPKTTDNLFVNDYVYDVGIKNEIAISAYYVPGKREKGARVNDELVLKPTNYFTMARHNAYWYVRPLEELAPSFKWAKVPFTPPDDLVPLNPSVCLWQNKVWCNVRAVNYRIDENGAYLIRGTDGTANRENPINTRNFVVDLGRLEEGREAKWWECYRPGNLPCEFPLVTGFEDMRLYERPDGLAFSATCRQIAADGICEQVRARLVGFKPEGTIEAINKWGPTGGFMTEDLVRMLREPRMTEKNWSPIAGSGGLFMRWPGEVVYDDGSPCISHPSPVPGYLLSGSSQVIPWSDKGCYLAVVHTANPLPGCDYKRFYYHRFIEYDRSFAISRISMPWVFNDKVIEFCAGLTHNPSHTDELIMSYGFKDEEARLGRIASADVEKLLAEGHHYGR